MPDLAQFFILVVSPLGCRHWSRLTLAITREPGGAILTPSQAA
jgi:hypothetical protein